MVSLGVRRREVEAGKEEGFGGLHLPTGSKLRWASRCRTGRRDFDDEFENRGPWLADQFEDLGDGAGGAW